MIRIRRRGVIALVARRAFLRSPLVIAVFMAICTGKRYMTSRQRELRGCGMIEVGSRPCRCCMADCAILRESGGYMVRILRSVVITNMAGNAFLRLALIDPILMAVRARKLCVTAG